MINRMNGDYWFGSIRADQMILPANSVGDAEVDATRPIGVNKLYHMHCPVYTQDRGAAVVAKRSGLHIAVGPGTLQAFQATLSQANGGGTVTVDLYKNGVSVLSGLITITTEAAFDVCVGTISTAAYVAGDTFEVVVAVTGSVGQGLTVRGVFEEEP